MNSQASQTPSKTPQNGDRPVRHILSLSLRLLNDKLGAASWVECCI